MSKNKIITINRFIFYCALFLSFTSNTIASQQERVKALVVEVHGTVTAVLPGETKPIRLESKTKIPEGSKITILQNSTLIWYKQLYDKVEREELYGPATIQFPSEFLGSEFQTFGQKVIGGTTRGNDDTKEKDFECHYQNQITIPKTINNIPFLKFDCNHTLDYSKVTYSITDNEKEIRSGTFFNGFENTSLKSGLYKITFYESKIKLISSSLQVNDFDLDRELKIIDYDQNPTLPKDLVVTLKLCQLGYKYLCEVNLEYRYIPQQKENDFNRDRMLEHQLRSFIRDSLSFYN